MARKLTKVGAQPCPRKRFEAHIDPDKWQIEHIRQGLREAQAGQFASKAQVNQVIARLRKQ